VAGRNADDFHNARQLLHLVLSREKRVSSVPKKRDYKRKWVAAREAIQLRKDAPKRPHVYGRVIRQPQNHFRASIEAALRICIRTTQALQRGRACSHLNVGVYPLVFEATGAKIYDFDVAFVWLLQQDVLGLQVAVNHLELAVETPNRAAAAEHITFS
jgi:hypothetical protein